MEHICPVRWGCRSAWQSEQMINRVMKTGAAAVALAASALLALPASAQDASTFDRRVVSSELLGGERVGNQSLRGDRSITRRRGNGRNDFRRNRRDNHRTHQVSHHLNAYGQTPREVQYLIDQAIYACDCQLKIDAERYGYHDAEFRGVPYVEQIGPRGFVVRGPAKLFDGHDYSRQPFECAVRRGSIRRASQLYPVHQANYHRDGYRRNRAGFSISFGNRW